MLTFEAQGMSAGSAMDAADVAIWCDVHGFAAAGKIAPRLNRLSLRVPAPSISHRPDGTVVINAFGGSLLSCGSACIDVGIAAAESGGQGWLVIRQLADLDLMPGLAAIAARRDIDAVLLSGTGEAMSVALARGNSRDIELWSLPAKAAGGRQPEKDELTIGYGSPVLSWCDGLRAHTTEIISPSAMEERRRASITDGIEVDEPAWIDLQKTAKDRLVPESEKSRRRGAGIGANDEG